MSRLERKLSPLFSATLTHPRTRESRRRLAELGRRVRGSPHRVLYFHQVEENRFVLMKSGFWGVPSFRLLGEGGRARLLHLGTRPALARRGDRAATRRSHRSVRRY